MHPAQVKFIEVSKRFAVVGLQAAQLYNVEQAKLDLEHVLSQERLCSVEGTQTSLASLSSLESLTAAHKDTFSRVFAACTSELNAALAELPRDLQDSYRAGLAESVNWQLNAQSEFYANRERWIAAATAICELIECRRSTCVFSEAGVDFVDDADLATFGELLERVKATRQSELKQLQERMARFARSAAVLGMGGVR